MALLAAVPLLAQSAEKLEFFEKKVRPLFAAKCYECHGAKVQMSGLNLSNPADFPKVVVPGDVEHSRLFQAVLYTEKIKMPPAGKLAGQELADLKSWIEMGAVGASGPGAPAQSGPATRLPHNEKEHWAFQPVKDYAPPKVRNEKWARSPIDRFILARLEKEGIAPAAQASRLTLLRRATYDLIGLPPTTREIDDFLADNSKEAFAKVVDRLLASPHYGERWGRHWLDLARFADSTGMDEDHIYPNAWRYRDYVLKAFNDDLPYDRFITEQLAGDLLPGSKALVATGFLALGPKPLAQQDRVKAIYDVVDEQIDTTTKAFLGLTVACARCHDHKFDPILTRDYYALASIFASTSIYRNLGRPGAVSYLYDAPLDPDEYGRYQAHRWRMYGKQLEMEEALAEDWARENGMLRTKVAEFLTAAWQVERKGVKPDSAAVEKWVRWLRSAGEKAREGYLKKWLEATDETIGQVAKEYQERYIKAATRADEQLEGWRKRFASEVVEDRDLPPRPKSDAGDPFYVAATFNGGPMEIPESARVATLRREWKYLEKSLPPPPALATAVCDGPSVDQRVFLHGDPHSPGEPVAKQFPIVLAGNAQQPVTQGSGRLELARWLTSPGNPLTARVMMNRIWQGHFGEALVRTPNNWGRTGEKPSHPELLDFLASRFVQSGWSIKTMHRLIMLSSAYQMSTHAGEAALAADPANRLISRFERLRMSVEQIRDSFLALSGNLDPTIGGSLIPAGTMKTKRPSLNPDDLKRRTLYVPVRRGSIPTLLATFDYGDATTPGEGRPRTNVAPQALFMLNSRFVLEQAAGLAKRLLEDAGLSDTQRVERAYLMTLTRRPEAAEIDSALTYLAHLEKQLGKPDAHATAWQSLCHVLMSTNEFLYLN
ncbi:MAG TPA: PSD1 and planctomycete cytochrome C domain-containing protein [Bryobacteraceae bacterium]|nr:PSD1 and planctomycete cytochrome C domain-containing protein [Bryobacteraceae bacterium]